MIKRIINNEFNKNVLTLMTGSSVAQAIPVLISPILTRLYSPSQFGTLALFIAITSILGSIANGRYELAIVLPKKDEDAINIAALSVLISTVFSTLIFFVVLFLDETIIVLFNLESLGKWIYLIPLITMLIGLFNSLNYLNTRMKQYKVIAQSSMIKAIVTAIVQLGLGMLKVGAVGLITGQALSHLFGNIRLATNIFRQKKLIRSISKEKMKILGKVYKDFPKYSLWAIFVNSLSQNLIQVFISSFYSLTIAGFYALTQRILGLPLGLIGNSIGQVFYQTASNNIVIGQSNANLYKKTLKKLSIISIVIFILILILAPIAVPIVFGNEWSEAIYLLLYLTPLYLLRFITTPISTVTSVYGKQKLALIWQIGLLIVTILSFFIAKFLNLSIEQFLLIYVPLISFQYLLLLLIGYRLSMKKLKDEQNEQAF